MYIFIYILVDLFPEISCLIQYLEIEDLIYAGSVGILITPLFRLPNSFLLAFLLPNQLPVFIHLCQCCFSTFPVNVWSFFRTLSWLASQSPSTFCPRRSYLTPSYKLRMFQSVSETNLFPESRYTSPTPYQTTLPGHLTDFSHLIFPKQFFPLPRSIKQYFIHTHWAIYSLSHLMDQDLRSIK